MLKKTLEGDYEFYKEEKSEVIGEANIKRKNIEINEKLKRGNVPYEELFYMVEIGEKNIIEDDEYLKNYDLVDIPGLS